MRVGLPVLALLALAACAPEIPDSAAGVGFDDYAEYTAGREAQLRGEVAVLSPQDLAQADEGSAVAAQTMAALGPAGEAAPQPSARTNNPGISDEQDFSAVTARESIQSDRQRLEAQRQQYRVIEPEPLPGRAAAGGPNIVQYAINAPNAVGQPVYSRPGRVSQDRFLRNCAKYASSDLAQEALLKAGGPQRDRLGVDPDGDGFACYWDPTPFRAALR
ncbi:hypothetical protein SAMN05444722_3622 [Rhodovulum sp. ES.010]|uniref:hypothetical protein n=1 Tax=Rhodovulum sp. ES.010 TaxID=1882821 RepID=UPI00092B625C|nr:hypothetical protein [Rhodovulum sp. ES.010]SIO56579.1 hypothetical protein SAMN05444722_3622 [Rhodovulum sp. ES.010]